MIRWIETRSVALSACLSVMLLLGTSVTALAAPPVDDTVNIQYTLEGCREPGTYTAPPALCADSEYTPGNLGNEWEELDFVPHRATLSAGSGQTTTATTFTLAADFEYGTAGGYQGYDYVTEPAINDAKSDDSCVLTFIGPQTVGPSLAGGVYSSKYRTITLSQDPGTTCVMDYYLRLAGPEQADLYSGASLHAYLLNADLQSAGVGEKRVPLPVNKTQPQKLSVTASASQGSSHTWEVSKTATPDELDLPNTCPTGGRTTSSTTVRVTWDKSAATAGAITGSAIITAENPAHRDLLIRIQSEIKSGTSSLSPAQTMDTGFVTLPPGISTFTHNFTAPAGSTNLNAVVSGTYKDPIVGDVLGTLSRTANATVTITQETPTNGTALITDVESIGTGYKFRVTDVDASSTAVETGGAFTPAYAPGSSATLVTGLTWNYTASDDGWVEFDKVVVADGATNSGTTLTDTATVKTADGQTTLGSDTSDDSANVTITAAALAPITVNKTIPDIFDGTEAEGFDEVTFTFTLKTPAGNPVAGVDPITITFDNNSPDSNTDGKLEGSATFAAVPTGSYRVHETAPTGWATRSPLDVTIDASPAECSDSVSFDNDNDKATAKVRKQTLPAGDGAGWTFILKRNGVEIDRETTTADGQSGGYVTFSDTDGPIELTEGSYTIEEVLEDGYLFEDSSSECSFVVDYPQSNGYVYDCTFVNKKLGSITVVKDTVDVSGDDQEFDFDLDPDNGDGTQSLSDGGSHTFDGLTADDYTLTEDLPVSGWDLTDISCVLTGTETAKTFVEDLELGTAGIDLGHGENVTCTYENTKEATLIVEKQTDPAGSGETFVFTGDELPSLESQRTIADDGTIEVDGLDAGSYSVAETAEDGWDLTDIECDDDDSSGDLETSTASFELDAGETVTCTFTNTQRGSITVVKQTQPDGDQADFGFSGAAFGQDPFTLSDGEDETADDLETGTYTVSEANPEPGWKLASISCDGDVSDGEGGDNSASSGDLVTRTATFELDPGENVTCTFTNTKRGSITVVKQTIPDGDTDTFTFDLDEDASDPISDGQSDTWGDLPDDTYTLSEDMVSDDEWDLTDIDCGDAQVDEDLEAGSVDVTIDSGENGGANVTCIFTNTKRGAIVVEKQTNPDGAFGIFNFTGDAAGALTDGGQITVGNLVPGDYTSTEAESSFSLSSIACDDAQSASQSSGSVQTRTATFRVDPGETVKCVFTNDAPPPPPPPVVTDVEIDKTDSTDPVTAGQNFDYILTVTNNGPVVAENVTVSDTLPAGLGFVSVTTTKGGCAGGTTISCSLGSLAVGESVTITVTVSTSLETPSSLENTAVVSTTTNETDLTNNRDTEPTTIVTPAPPQATIIVQKETIPLTDSTQTFEFVGDVAGNLGDGDTASAVVDAGTYSVTEIQAGAGEDSKWTLLSIECDDEDSTGDVDSLTATFVADEGETVTCVFTNLEEEVLPTFIPPKEEPKPSGPGPEVLPKVVEPGVLPFTGGEPQNLVALALLLVLSGAGGLLAARIRRNEE